MNTIILATDGSTHSDEAARYLVASCLLYTSDAADE